MPKRATLSTRSLSTSTATTDQVPKNSGLTGAELDSNFLELRDQTFGVVGDDSSTIDIAAGGTLYIQGGTNCSTTTNSDGSITINTQADQDVFKTISVAGQNDVVADSTTDSLTLVAGNGMTITTDNSADSITFAADSTGNFTFSGDEMNNDGDFTIQSTATAAQISIIAGTDGSDANSRILLDTRRIFVGQNSTNVAIQAPLGGGDMLIANGGSTGSPGTYHNSIELTDSSNGEINITPKSGKWVDFNSKIRIDDANIKALGSADTLELQATSQSIHNKVNKTTFGSGDGSSNSTLTTTSSADMILNTNNGTASGSITIQDGANNQIRLIPDGTGDVVIGNFTFDADQTVGAGQDDYVFTYDNSTGKISLEPAGGGASLGDLTAVGSTLISPSNADLTLAPSGTGKVNISEAYTLPSSDGNAGEVLQTNGSGVLAFATASAINIDGGTAASTYGAITAIDGGDAT